MSLQHDAAGNFRSDQPRWWRLIVVASATLILCSCRQASQLSDCNTCAPPAAGAAAHSPLTLPPQAFTGSMPGAFDPDQPWSPPGIRGPWPADEYIHDGGDAGENTVVTEDFGIHGLEAGGTIAHFDAPDGRRIASASNRVDIYAPRFAAVRHVRGVAGNEAHLRVADYHKPVKLNLHQEGSQPTTTVQRVQTERQIAAVPPVIGQSTAFVGAASNNQLATEYDGKVAPLEDLQVYGADTFEQSQKAVLAKHIDAALTWSTDLSVQVTIESRAATEVSGGQRAELTYQVEDGTGEPTIRIVKQASTRAARPGEMIDFTIDFQNTGRQPIGNVTIVDNLVSRLEYVADSQTCSVAAEFFTEQNDGGTLVLRWEVTAPLPPGQAGQIKFRCKVR